MNALFPEIAGTQTQPELSTRLLNLTHRAVVILILPPALLAAVFAHPLLTLWLDPAFAASSTPVLQLLLVGIFINSAARVPYTLLQAHGRADLTAKLHLLELPMFALLLIGGVHWLGITGAALAWTLRVALDTALLYLFAWWLHRSQRTVLGRGVTLLCLAIGAMLLVIYAVHGPMQIALTSIIAAACAFAALDMMRLIRRDTIEKITP